MYAIKSESYSRKRRTPASLIIFINEPKRPINKGDIDGDFIWRREISYSSLEKNQELIQIAAKQLNCQLEDIKIKFSRKAGCSMCPCSPGLFVYKKNFSRPSYYCLPEIWVENI